MISAWIRVIRVRFLLSSVIAVFTGLAISWYSNSSFDLFYAVMTLGGVLALHASVDLLNDYWDFKRGIDTTTKRTKMSGGTGVLPEGLLEPSHVYRAGILFLIFGAVIGGFFVVMFGVVIAILLAFAIISIYFYSTKIVDSGLAEVFVAIKGTMIVLGTIFIQTNQITPESVLGGIVIGVLSSLVLFITSFPDYNADNDKGRKTLVIVLGRKNASKFYWIFPFLVYGIIISGVVLQYFPMYSMITLFSIPLLVQSGKLLQKNYDNSDKIVSTMSKTLLFSRFTGTLFVISFLIPTNYS
jgi:1,4-dihydroxy-2-naphthoate polyprenyltransferase